MDDEMRFHLESRAADLVRRGVPAAEAAPRATEFGSIEKQKDLSRASVGSGSSTSQRRSPLCAADVPQEQGVRGDGRVHARARHRGEHRDL
jgi:hypothetical protein